MLLFIAINFFFFFLILVFVGNCTWFASMVVGNLSGMSIVFQFRFLSSIVTSLLAFALCMLATGIPK